MINFGNEQAIYLKILPEHLNDTIDLLQAGNDSVPGDTIMDTFGAKPEAFGSLFHSGLQADALNNIPHSGYDHPAWIPLLLVAGLILFAWVKLFYGRRLGMIFRGVFAKNYANQLIREGNLFNERIGLVLFFLHIFMASLFVYLATPLFNVRLPEIPDLLLYLLITSSVLGLWVFKAAYVRLLSLLFKTGESSRELVANMFLYNLFTGIALMPALWGMAFTDREVFFYISLIIIVVVYIIRLGREAVIGFTVNKFSAFHLFLYLCTLEILPLIVLAKILNRNMIL